MVFHFTRGLALYQRGREYKSIHASAVSGDGGAVLFSGEESAGKSTLFCKACIDYGYRPLASDRVFLNVEDDHYRAESWPGYVSLCEGTLLDYDLLHAAAIAYEAGDYKYTTQKYDRQLKKTYVKEYGAKRMYPMHWFENATGVEFIRNSGVRAVCFLKLRPGMGSTAVRKLDLNAKMDWDLCTNLLMRNSMDFSEDAFLPWHNYGLPDCGGVDCEMFRRCGASVYVGDIDPLYLDQFFISINDT
jgi:hypothetical protein